MVRLFFIIFAMVLFSVGLAFAEDGNEYRALSTESVEAEAGAESASPEEEEPGEIEKMKAAEEEYFGMNDFLPPESALFSPLEVPRKSGYERRHLLREYFPISFTSERTRLAAGGRNGYSEELKNASATISIVPESITGKFDIPVEYNEYVQMYIDFFQQRGRKYFEKWLFRSGRYIPQLQPILREYGLPEDTIYLAMIESGFSTKAYSRARALGVWQFIEPTAKQYGLRINFWVDERRDPIKATHAAARFLNELYQKFGDWHLAWAAYNAGGGKISRAIRGSGSNIFWEIHATKHISRETKHYVPKLIACAMIVKEPDKFGFADAPRDTPVDIEELTVEGAVDFRVIARLSEVALNDIADLNPAYIRGMTEPKRINTLRLPLNAASLFAERIQTLKPEERFLYAEYSVKKGDALSTIAHNNGSRAEAISDFNGGSLKNLRVGQKLIVPKLLYPGLDELERKLRYKERFHWTPRRYYTYTPDSALKGKTHMVRRGENLWGIASKYKMPVEELMRINGISPDAVRDIKVGQSLKLYSEVPGESKGGKERSASKVGGGSGKSVTTVYEVKSGDTIWDIAQRFGLDASELMRQNNLGRRSRIYPGQKLKITYKE
ncbi:MAG: hypothetical protein Kow0090_19600 [Myxococcota bacterium]